MHLNPKSLEQRIDYAFSDPQLLERALTHKSASSCHYERLEFLGDAVLEYIISVYLFRNMHDATEQELTLMRANLVKNAMLASVAREINLNAYLRVGLGESRTGVANNAAILANAFEALVGAIAHDGGIEAASRVVENIYAEHLDTVRGNTRKDGKSLLQEFTQSQGKKLPVYTVVDGLGKEHQRDHYVECQLTEYEIVDLGIATTVKEAEKLAADLVVKKLVELKYAVLEGSVLKPLRLPEKPS